MSRSYLTSAKFDHSLHSYGPLKFPLTNNRKKLVLRLEATDFKTFY